MAVERIRKALDQAEKVRAAQGNAAKNIDKSGEDIGSASRPLLDQSTQSSPMNYSRTKVVDVSQSVLEKNRLVAALAGHELTDAYRILRTRVLQSMNKNDWHTLAITSPASGAGKTLTAINLSISLAREVNRTVLLVDFDLRRPSVHSYFGYDPEYGLSDYLFGDIELESILFSPSIDRLVILPGRESVHNSSEMLRSPKMVALVEELKSRYSDRLIIIDLPPILAVDDALAFAPFVDSMLMVVENGATKKEDLEKAMALLKNVPLVGTVLNKSEGAYFDSYGKS